MQKHTVVLLLTLMALAGFAVGRWSGGIRAVRADSAGTPQIEVRPIEGNTSLTVYYPGPNKLFVYQNPFVGLPTWQCSYSIQLSTPGGAITRQPCPNPGSQF